MFVVYVVVVSIHPEGATRATTRAVAPLRPHGKSAYPLSSVLLPYASWMARLREQVGMETDCTGELWKLVGAYSASVTVAPAVEMTSTLEPEGGAGK